MVIAGLDFSYTSPALCVHDEGEFTLYGIKAKKKQESKTSNLILLDYPELYKSQTDRFDKLTDLICHQLFKHDVEFVYLEGYSYSSNGNTFDIGEATGLMKWKLEKSSIGYEVVAPSAVKKFATGKGNSNKIGMLEFFCQQDDHNISIRDLCEEDFGTKIPKPLDDIVDAYWLCRYGINHQLQKLSTVSHP